MLSTTKLNGFTQRVADLPDEPMMSPSALKARFDACPEELRGKHNELVDGLTGARAAQELGFTATAGVPADNVQAAIESVQRQLTGIALNSVPDGSIELKQLGDGLREKITQVGQLQGALDAEINQRTQETQNLQEQIAASRVVLGTYYGNGQSSQLIKLGFHPRAVIVSAKTGQFMDGSIPVGGLATRATPASDSYITVTPEGFTVRMMQSHGNANSTSAYFNPFIYMAFA